MCMMSVQWHHAHAIQCHQIAQQETLVPSIHQGKAADILLLQTYTSTKDQGS